MGGGNNRLAVQSIGSPLDLMGTLGSHATLPEWSLNLPFLSGGRRIYSAGTASTGVAHRRTVHRPLQVLTDRGGRCGCEYLNDDGQPARGTAQDSRRHPPRLAAGQGKLYQRSSRRIRETHRIANPCRKRCAQNPFTQGSCLLTRWHKSLSDSIARFDASCLLDD